MTAAGSDPAARLAAALAAHRRATGESVLGQGARGTTTRVPWDEASDAVVKETRRQAGLRGAFSALLLRSRARRAFEAAVALERAMVPVAAPLGFLEEGASSVLVSRHVPGERLDAALSRALTGVAGAGAEPRGRELTLAPAAPNTTRVRELALRATELAARVHAAGVAHGDFKPANLIVARGSRLVVIDLDGARVGAVGRRGRAKDLAALDAYGQRGAVRVSRRVRLEAFAAYVAIAGLSADEADALRRAVVARSLRKRERWRSAGA